MNTLGWILLAVTVLLLAVVGSVIVLRNRRRPRAEPIEHFQCPHCRQRLGYRRNQAGHKGACPRCRKAITFPGGPGRK
jgi:hypothetical protein